MPRKRGVFGVPFLIPYICGIINSEDKKKYFYRKKYSWRACLLCILINNMVEFLLPGRGGGWPSVPQNKLLLPWMIFSCLAQTVSPICSKSSQVKFFLQHTLLFFTKYTMPRYSNTNCFLFQAKSICVPKDYVKFELPPESPTVVYIGIDIKDIPKVKLLNIFSSNSFTLSF